MLTVNSACSGILSLEKAGNVKVTYQQLSPNISLYKDIHITFSGQIYNRLPAHFLPAETIQRRHPLSTESIAQLYQSYGERLNEHLDGSYALATFDECRGRLLLCRDRVGFVPLYYVLKDDVLHFGTDLKQLAANVERIVNPEAVMQLLLYPAILPPATIYAGVDALLPGETLVFGHKNGCLEVKRRHHSRLTSQPLPPLSIEEAADVLEDGLVATLDQMTMDSSEIGVLLSGGLDSSLLTALLSRKLGKKPHTFTIEFDIPKAGRWINDADYAQIVAEHLQTSHSRIRLTAQDLEREFPVLLSGMGQPSGDLVNVFLATQAIDSDRLISGVGSDELQFGNPWMVKALRQRRLLRLLDFAMSQGIRNLVPNVRLPVSLQKFSELPKVLPFQLRTYVASRQLQSRLDAWKLLSPSIKERLGNDVGAIENPIVRFLATRLPDLYRDETIFKDTVGYNALIKSMCWLHLLNDLSNILLQDEWSATQCSGVQLLQPFCQAPILQFLLSLPGSYRYRREQPKVLVRRLAARHLPAELLSRPKMGFIVPFDYWLKDSLKGMVEDYLDSTRISRQGYLDRDSVSRLKVNFYSQKKLFQYHLVWNVIVLSSFLDEYR